MNKLILFSMMVFASLALFAEPISSFLGVEFGSRVTGETDVNGLIEVKPKKKFRSFNTYYVVPTFSSRRVASSGALVTLDMRKGTSSDVKDELDAIREIIIRRYKSYGIREHKDGDALYNKLLYNTELMSQPCTIGEEDFSVFTFTDNKGNRSQILYLYAAYNDREKECTIVLKVEDMAMICLDEREKQDRINKRKITIESNVKMSELDAL